MGIIYWLRDRAHLLFLLVLVSFSACTDTLESEQVVYDNDFSNLDLAGFYNARLQIFQNDTVVGYYHNEEVGLTVSNLPAHELLKITLDILIHDSWDGNSDDGVGGPDFWFFGVDNEEVFRTTFSNSPCETTYCLFQSYPDAYFRQNLPKSGSVDTKIPGLCLFGASDNYTTRYSITKIIDHKNFEAKIYMNSELVSTNSQDPFCDESWSLANVKVEALTLK